MDETLVLGAVAYDPKVVAIWDGFKRYFRERDFGFDYVLYSNYERQVEALLAGQIDVAWNSPLAWVRAKRQAFARGLEVRPFAMRDADCDVRSVIVTPAGSTVKDIDDLRGKTVAVGASDSPQATLLPLLFILKNGLEPDRDFRVQRHEVLVGLHGDHVGGERDAARALTSGETDAACMFEANYLAFIGDGLLPPLRTSVLAYTATYDHCNMTAGPSAAPDFVDRFRTALLSMSYSDPAVRPLFDLEGLTAWRDARTSGYGMLEEAVDRLELQGEAGLAAAGGYSQ
jgi:ABC-type phosphate/phosphonate transport system substrate-binding protein